jgi:hypothetical protein
MDQEEAKEVFEKDRTEKTLAELYDSVLIPALAMVKEDRQRGVLEKSTEQFIYQSTRALIEEQSLDGSSEPSAEGPIEDAQGASQSSPARRVICVAARSDGDEIVGAMLAQLLQHQGDAAECIAVGDTSQILEQIRWEDAEVVCISALAPFALAEIRGLYQKVYARMSSPHVVVGLWGFSGDMKRAVKRIGGGQVQVCTTLAQAMRQIHASSRRDGNGVVLSGIEVLEPRQEQA